jgi:hypothetical protein
MSEKGQDRRCFLLAAGGAVAGAWIPPVRWKMPFRPNPVWQRVRTVVRNGQLGRIAFCGSVLGCRDSLLTAVDCVQFVFDGAEPVSVSAQAGPPGDRGSLIATFRYPGFVASYEQRAAAAESTVICGAAATLAIGWDRRSRFVVFRVLPGDDSLTEDARPSSVPPRACLGAPPWANMETRARSATAARLLEMALREGRPIDCSRNTEAVWT